MTRRKPPKNKPARRNPDAPYIFSRKKLEGLRKALQEGVEVVVAQQKLNEELDNDDVDGAYYNKHYREIYLHDVLGKLFERYIGPDIGGGADFANATWGLGPKADCRTENEAFLFEGDDDGRYEILAHGPEQDEGGFELVEIVSFNDPLKLLAWVEKQLAKG